jgi:RNA polymerase sigma factor (TIGR02999 family)
VTDPGELRQALDDLFSIAYEELRRLAASVKYSNPNASLSTSTLINEAWLKLVNSSRLELSSRLHFTCVAAKAMRQIVVDEARRRGAVKRQALFVTFDDALEVAVTSNRDVLALDGALKELARLNPRQARVVELRFFGGLEAAEIVSVLGVAERTVQRDWRVARAWLEARIRGRAEGALKEE